MHAYVEYNEGEPAVYTNEYNQRMQHGFNHSFSLQSNGYDMILLWLHF